MTKFDLNPKDVYTVLKNKKISNLYHANTISTSITYLKEKNLLSRKYADDNNLNQTEQYSDELDKKYGIWDDIFLDALDIHEYLRRPNLYGPFLFSFNLELLNSGIVSFIRITKKNPVNWKDGETEDDWYYSNLEEFENSYLKGNKYQDVGKMFILKGLNGKLPLKPYLNKFILDNSNIIVNYNNVGTYLSEILTTKFTEVFEQYGYNEIEKQLRHKTAIINCSCWNKYKYISKNDFQDFRRLFHPTP